jgi:hypothetical protein
VQMIECLQSQILVFIYGTICTDIHFSIRLQFNDSAVVVVVVVVVVVFPC